MSRPSASPAKTNSVMRGGASTFASRILIQLIQFAIFVIVAHWVHPSEFGLFALVAAVVVILNQLAMAGWPEFIMQCDKDDDRLGSALLVALFCGGTATVLGVVLSLLSTLVTDAPNLFHLALVLSLNIVFTTAGATYASILNWQNKLETAAVCVLLSEIINFGATIWALYAGYGILSLAYGRIASSIFWTVSTAAMSGVRPAPRVSRQLVRDMFKFSKHIIATMILANLRIYASTFIVGGFIGTTAVGYFRASQRIATGFDEMTGEPSRVLAWSIFRSARDSENGIGKFDTVSQVFFRIQLYCAAPFFLSLTVLGPDLVEGLLGPDWLAAVPVLQILAIASLIRTPGHAMVPIMSLAGKMSSLPKYILVNSLITVALIFVGAQYGIVMTAVAEVVAAAIVMFISAVVMRIHANIHWSAILSGCWGIAPALLVAFIFPIMATQFDLLGQIHPLLRYFVLSLCIVVVYVPAVLLIDKSMRALFTNAIASRSSQRD